MHFGAVFIALIGFTVTMFILPPYLQSVFQRDIDTLRGHVLRLGPKGASPAEAQSLFDALTRWEGDDRIRNIKWQKFMPYVSVLIVVEVCVFALSSYYVARGRDVPGFIEDMAIGMTVVLVLATMIGAYRILCDNAHYNRYLRSYRRYVALFPDEPV
jgi:hypothetical protein